MDSNPKIWKYISKQLFLAKNNPEETIYQKTITDIFTDQDLLGWPEELVIREYGIKMGSTKKCDIVLLDSTKTPFIAIEVKLANSPSDGVEQLGSYMDRCTPRLKYGITIKDSINLFYDEDTGHSIHSENDAIFSVSFDNSDSNGEEFV
ncbi:MAG: type I restriction enzyme HsdR N-terminal domain-containing protein, partial [Duncaniella sp.]|uniref:type I restriction enzyme HsdR N-terminal domain-containing protein n=1 Tax=Duncaniella sp. TaxID=2518496 RepID=UPI0023C08264